MSLQQVSFLPPAGHLLTPRTDRHRTCRLTRRSGSIETNRLTNRRDPATVGSKFSQNTTISVPFYLYVLRVSYVDKYNEVRIIDASYQFTLPDPSKAFAIDYSRIWFVKKTNEIDFTDGMLTSFHQIVPSPFLGGLNIPKSFLQALIPIPGAASATSSAAKSGTGWGKPPP
jgi:hypothetical protein